jgi:hypothetical protein
MAQTLGIIDVYWNGAKLDNEPGGTVKLGGVRNKSVIYSRKVGNAQMMMESEINVTVPIEAGVRVTDTFSTGTGELQVHCDTGQIFSWDEAFLTDPLDFSAGDGGKLKLTFKAGEPVEV